MKSKDPIVYKRSCDHRWIAVVRMPGGRSVRRGTGCRHKDSAEMFANLLQIDIQRRAAAGDLLPPPR